MDETQRSTPLPPSSSLFDRAAATWDDKPRRVALATAIGKTILRQVPTSQSMDVMDYGCGTGLLSLFLRPHVRSVTGADSSAGMLDILQGKIAESGLDGMDVARLDLECDALPTDRFHMIVTAMTMHHVRNTDKVLGAFREMLLPAGTLCIADLDTEPGTFHANTTAADTVAHHGFDREEFKGRLRDLGFVATCDTTAHTIDKETVEGRTESYPVFLVVARRPD